MRVVVASFLFFVFRFAWDHRRLRKSYQSTFHVELTKLYGILLSSAWQSFDAWNSVKSKNNNDDDVEDAQEDNKYRSLHWTWKTWATEAYVCTWLHWACPQVRGWQEVVACGHMHVSGYVCVCLCVERLWVWSFAIGVVFNWVHFSCCPHLKNSLFVGVCVSIRMALVLLLNLHS